MMDDDAGQAEMGHLHLGVLRCDLVPLLKHTGFPTLKNQGRQEIANL